MNEQIGIKIFFYYITYNQPPDADTWNGQIIGYKIVYGDVNDITEVNAKTTLGYDRCEMRITNLKPFTTYRIVVKAFNSIGAGPDSDFIRVTTSEGGINKDFKQMFSSFSKKMTINRKNVRFYSTWGASTKCTVFAFDSGIITNELESTAHSKSPWYYIRI